MLVAKGDDRRIRLVANPHGRRAGHDLHDVARGNRRRDEAEFLDAVLRDDGHDRRSAPSSQPRMTRFHSARCSDRIEVRRVDDPNRSPGERPIADGRGQQGRVVVGVNDVGPRPAQLHAAAETPAASARPRWPAAPRTSSGAISTQIEPGIPLQAPRSVPG